MNQSRNPIALLVFFLIAMHSAYSQSWSVPVISRDPGYADINVRLDGGYEPKIRFTRWTGTSGTYHNAFVGQFYNTNYNDYSFAIGVGGNSANNQDLTIPVITIPINGNVGIGTTYPNYSLEVSGNQGIIMSTGNEAFVGYYDRTLKASSTSNHWGWYAASGKTHLWDGVNQTDRLTIMNTGNVGIGTSDPQHKLDVEGNVEFGTGSSNLELVQNGQVFEIRHHDPGVAWRDISLNAYGGNVGIGTTNPTAKFEVNGEIKSRLSPDVYPDKNVARIVPLGFSGITGAMNWALRGVYQHWDGVNMNAIGGDLDLIKSLNGNTVLATKADGSSLGNVGIGTATTGSHRLAVEGSIGAREIKVEATSWPDYVFEEDHSLIPLSELEAFVKENHHLPEVPSEAEVTENGVELGATVNLLLKKIEELTLYTIEQQKEIEELKKGLLQLTSK